MKINDFAKKTYSTFTTVFFAGLMLVLNTPVYADQLSDRLGDVTDATDETSFVQAIYYLAIPISVVCLVGLGAFASYKMLTSQGNPDKINEAKEILTNAIMGFALIGLSIAIMILIQNVLQIPDINP
jgi:hypothetical protein